MIAANARDDAADEVVRRPGQKFAQAASSASGMVSTMTQLCDRPLYRRAAPARRALDIAQP